MLELGRLGLGTAPLGGLYEAVDAEKLTPSSIEHGNSRSHIDTAPYYGSGLAEQRLGTALRDRPRDELSSRRGRATLATGQLGLARRTRP